MMLKMILLAGAVTIGAPALAQTGTPAGQVAPQSVPTAPQTDPVPTTTAPGTMQADPTTPAPADPAAAAAPSQSQVAQVVEQQFATYDKDGNGALSKAEFSSWMTALKTQANAKAGSPAAETAWNDAAFKQADGDKSATVSKTELTGFLVKGASGAS